MVHSKYIFIASLATFTFVLYSSLASAETRKSGHHSLIHRPQLKSTPPATLDLTVTPFNTDERSTTPSTLQPTLRHKLLKRPATAPGTTTRSNSALPPDPLQLDDTTGSTKK